VAINLLVEETGVPGENHGLVASSFHLEINIFFRYCDKVYNVNTFINKMNCELMLTYDTPAYMFNVNKNQLSR